MSNTNDKIADKSYIITHKQLESLKKCLLVAAEDHPENRMTKEAALFTAGSIFNALFSNQCSVNVFSGTEQEQIEQQKEMMRSRGCQPGDTFQAFVLTEWKEEPCSEVIRQLSGEESLKSRGVERRTIVL